MNWGCLIRHKWRTVGFGQWFTLVTQQCERCGAGRQFYDNGWPIIVIARKSPKEMAEALAARKKDADILFATGELVAHRWLGKKEQ